AANGSGPRTPNRGDRSRPPACPAAARSRVAGLAGSHARRGRHAAVVVCGGRRTVDCGHQRGRRACGSMTGLGTLAVWPGPALLAWVVATVAAGAPGAPVLVLAVALAPLLALLQPARATAPRHPVTLALVAIVAALVLSAHLAALADGAALLGARRWHAIVLAAALTLLVTLMPGARRWPGVAPLIGGAALLGVLLAAAVSTGRAPWAAWADAAARPALVFSGQSPWVIEGERFVRRTTLAFDDGQRAVAVAPGPSRVRDAGARSLRARSGAGATRDCGGLHRAWIVPRHQLVGRLRDAGRARGGSGGFADRGAAVAAPRDAGNGAWSHRRRADRCRDVRA